MKLNPATYQLLKHAFVEVALWLTALIEFLIPSLQAIPMCIPLLGAMLPHFGKPMTKVVAGRVSGKELWTRTGRSHTV